MRGATSSEPWRSTPSTRPRSRRCGLFRGEAASVDLVLALAGEPDLDLLRRLLSFRPLEHHFVLVGQRLGVLLEDLWNCRDAHQVVAPAAGVLGEIVDHDVALRVLEAAPLHGHRPQLRAGLAEAV